MFIFKDVYNFLLDGLTNSYGVWDGGHVLERES